MLEKEKYHLHQTLIILPFIAVGLLSLYSVVLTAWASGITPAAVIDLTNHARAEKSLPELRENPKLSQAARMKAEDMIKNDYFAHTSPTGIDPWHWLKQVGYGYKAAGENLAINFTNPKEQQNAWMKSETHRANILNAKYQEIGVAVVEGKIDGERSIVTVQMFGTPTVAVVDKTQAAVPAAKEATVPEIKGVESEESASLLNETQKETPLPVAKPAYSLETSQKMSKYDKMFVVSWLVAVILLLSTLLVGPITLLYRAYRLISLGVKAKKFQEQAKEETETPTSSLSVA